MGFEQVEQAARYDLTIQQGSTFTRTVNSSESIADYNFRGQIRRRARSSTVTASFSFEKLNDYDFRFSLTPTQTEAISPGDYVYDIEVYTTGDAVVARILEGDVSVSAEVTR